MSFSTLHPTPAYNVTHAHVVITPCDLPRQILLFPLQGAKYEHPIGDILRLKKKVADFIVLHVTAGRALSVAALQRQCSAPEGSPLLRRLMGNRARMMGFDVLDAIDNIKQFSDLETHLRHDFFPRRYLWLGVLPAVADALEATIIVWVRDPADTLVVHRAIQHVCLGSVHRTDNIKLHFDYIH